MRGLDVRNHVKATFRERNVPRVTLKEPRASHSMTETDGARTPIYTCNARRVEILADHLNRSCTSAAYIQYVVGPSAGNRRGVPRCGDRSALYPSLKNVMSCETAVYRAGC